MDENDILTTLHFAHEWGVDEKAARRKMVWWAQKLGLNKVAARSPSGQRIFAYSRSDAERIIAAEREREARTKTNAIDKKKKDEEIEYQIGTANRSDVMNVHELAELLNVSRPDASRIARRLEGKLGIQRVEARAASTQKIVAYMRSDGERLVKFFEEKASAKIARRKAKEKRKLERELIPQPPAPSSRNELFYCVELHPGHYKIGWTSDIEQRLKAHRTTNPNLRRVKSWPCKREQDAEATRYAMTFQGLQKLGPETFRTRDIESVVNYLDQFFNMGTDKDT
jgi:DNA-binding MarR family transcriptional regulator